MSKTPYEVRLEVLKMAQEMVDRENDIHNQDAIERVRGGAIHASSMPTLKSTNTDQVITQANALYSFVTKKDTKG
jgi:hypothetical protein